MLVTAGFGVPSAEAAVTCPNANPVVNENNCQGAGSTSWQLTNFSYSGIAGFSTETSVNKGQSVTLKIARSGGAGSADISVYRMGYYGGAGARLVHSATNVAVATGSLNCAGENSTTGLENCNNWANTYTIPAASLPASGVYLVKLKDRANNQDNHVVFVVRDDNRNPQSEVLFKLPTATYQAYNGYTDKALYDQHSTGPATQVGTRASKVSYDRPYKNVYNNQNWVLKADYPLIYWLERQGYDVSYTDDVAVHLNPGELLDHNTHVLGGHDEYWSGEEMAGYKAARNAGKSIVSFGANTGYWKVRYEDGGATMVCYKTVLGIGATNGDGTKGINDPGPDGVPNTADDALGLDQQAGTADDRPQNSTTTFRDNGAPPGQANAPPQGRVGPDDPENSLFGALYMGDNDPWSYPLRVPGANAQAEFAGDRIWRRTGLAQGSPTSIGTKLVGWEWDAIPTQAQYASKQPAGVKRLTETDVLQGAANPPNFLHDEGRVYATTTVPGQGSNMQAVKYTHSSGALLFSASTNQWSWGLGPHYIDSAGVHTYLDSPVNSADTRIQQATYNIFADTGVQPLTPIGISLDGNDAPTATFMISPTPVPVGGTATFNASASQDTEGPIAKYEWDLDGNGSYETDSGTNAVVTRTYNTETTLQIKLRVTDTTGLQAETTRALTVGSGLVAAYSFNEASGSTVADSSGKSNTGSITGATRVAGHAGNGLSFNGSGNLVTVPDATSLDLTNAMTLSAWVRPTTVADWRTIMLKEAPGDLAYGLYASSGNYGGSSVQRPSSWVGPDDVGGATALPANTWSHVTATYDGSTWRLYVNGTEIASRAFTGGIPVSSGSLRIGGNTIWGEYFTGILDDVRVYSRGLNALEVAADRDTPVGGTPPADTTAPTVSVTAPTNGSSVRGTVNLTADAADNVGISGVQFKVDGANVGAEDTTSPYTASWNTTGLSNGNHTVTAVARDAANNTTTSSTVTVTVDNSAPTASVTAPANGATVSGLVNVTATASDNAGVAGVQFRVDGNNLGAEDTASPFATTLDTTSVSNGTHTITAVARDAAGNTTTSATVTVTVSNTDTTAPTVSVTAPSSGATVNGTVSLTANASDNVGVAGVQFKVDGANVGAEDTTSPYAASWNTTTATEGTHTITAVARDAAGNTTTSTAVTVTVDNTPAPDTTPPTVSLTAPSNGALVRGSTNLTANAADNVGVSGVQFKVDGANVGAEDTTSPYSVAWNTTGATNGNHTITAVARDAAGNTTTSTAVTVTVDNSAPTVSLTAPANGATVSGASVNVAANASDNASVAGVQFRLDGANLGSEDTSSPFATSWNTTTATNGSHTLTAVARDPAGNTTTSSTATVTVSNAGPPAGLVAAYGFNEGSGSTAGDASGAGNVGTLSTPAWTTAGRFGGALTFNGSSDWVSVADANSLDLVNGMTLEAWVRPTAVSGWRTAIIKEDTGDLAYSLYAASDLGGGAARPSAWIAGNDVEWDQPIAANAWTHVATTYDRVNWRLYVNGTQVATEPMTSAIPVSTQPLRIGGNSIWGEYFAGQIDEVRIYNRALSAAEIAADQNAAVGP